MLYTSCTCKFYCVIGLSMRDALRIAKCQLYSGEWVINTSSWCIACIVYYTLTGYAGMSRWKRYKALGVRKRYVVWQWMTDTGSSCIVLKCTSQELNILGERTVHEVMFDKALFKQEEILLWVFWYIFRSGSGLVLKQIFTCTKALGVFPGLNLACTWEWAMLNWKRLRKSRENKLITANKRC